MTQDFSALAAAAGFSGNERWSLTVAGLAGAAGGLAYGVVGFLDPATHFPEAAAGLVSAVVLGALLAGAIAATRNVAVKAR